MKYRKVPLVLILIFCSSSLFAARNVYATADAVTHDVLEKVDSLIEQQQYASAFGALTNENEFFIAKKIEIATNYFVQSIMHTMFAFENLEEDQSLMEIRSRQEGVYNAILFDPAETVKKYVQTNGEKPILDYALGLYYSDVLRRYQGRWLISDDELVNNTITYLSKAYENDCWDSWSMSELAYAFMKRGEYENAIAHYSIKLEQDEEFTIDDDYNFGLCNFFCSDYQTAQKYMEKSLVNYADNPGYLYDTYWVLSAIYINTQQYDKGQNALDNCRSLDQGDYRLALRYISFYAILKDKPKTLQASAEFFTYGPENPSVPQYVIQEYFDRGIEEWLPEFFEQELARPELTLATQQNLYFHYAASLSYLDRKSEAVVIADKAREVFRKDDSLTDDIEQLLVQFCE